MRANVAQCDDCGLGHPADGLRLCLECFAREARAEGDQRRAVTIRNVAFVLGSSNPLTMRQIAEESGMPWGTAYGVIKDMRDAGYLVGVGRSRAGAILLAINPEDVHRFDSPVERDFWDAHRMLLLKPLAGLMPQVQHGRYRIDFAIEKRRFGIEIDGLQWHNQDSFIRDRNRQRELERGGWRIARFAAKEVMQDAEACVREAAAQAEALVSA